MNKLTRREILRMIGGLGIAGLAGMPAISALGSTFTQASSEQSRKLLCEPVISGPLWWIDQESAAWDISRWREELDLQRKIGFDLLWFTGEFSIELLDLCARRKVQVILDVGSTGEWWKNADVEREIEHCRKSITRIGERFSAHPAFYAWYIPHEIYWWKGKMAEYMELLYGTLVEDCKKAADLPVSISPFFIIDRGGAFETNGEFCPPDRYEQYWNGLLGKTGIDLVMLQDSGEHISFVADEDRHAFFSAMRRACKSAGSKLWGNVESAEVYAASMEDYFKRYGHAHPNTQTFIPVPIDRLRRKLETAAMYSERIVNWGYREFCRPYLGPEAAKWYEDYKRYYQKIRKSESRE